MATQNPIESEGTYNLPEAQLDRFMFKLWSTTRRPKRSRNSRHAQHAGRPREPAGASCDTLTGPDEILAVTARNTAGCWWTPSYWTISTRWCGCRGSGRSFTWGLRPVRVWPWCRPPRTLAAFHGRDYAVPDDVVELALPALRHRVILSAEAEVEGRTRRRIAGRDGSQRGGAAAVTNFAAVLPATGGLGAAVGGAGVVAADLSPPRSGLAGRGARPGHPGAGRGADGHAGDYSSSTPRGAGRCNRPL